MNPSVDNGTFTFSNHPDMKQENSTAQTPTTDGDAPSIRPKANPQWMKHNRPTLQLPESDQPPPQQRTFAQDTYGRNETTAPCVMNNLDLIDHAFSTPTSATPLNSGYYSSGGETPLLGLAGFGFISEKERDEQFADLNKIFDKMSLRKEQEKVSQTPPPDAKSTTKRLDKKVSFDVQPMPSPLSATHHEGRRSTLSEQNASHKADKASIWENSLDNEEQILEGMRIQHEASDDAAVDAARLNRLRADYQRDVHSATFPSGTASFAMSSPGMRSPNSATLPYFTCVQQTSSKKQSYDARLMGAAPGMPLGSVHPKYGHIMRHGAYPSMHDGDRKPLPMMYHPSAMDAMPGMGPMHHQQFEPMSPAYAMPGEYHVPKMHTPTKSLMPLTCFACRGVGHKATQCPSHPRPVVATSSTDVIVNCALHGKPRTSKNMFFNNKLGVWQCFAETECKSMLN